MFGFTVTSADENSQSVVSEKVFTSKISLIQNMTSVIRLLWVEQRLDPQAEAGVPSVAVNVFLV